MIRRDEYKMLYLDSNVYNIAWNGPGTAEAFALLVIYEVLKFHLIHLVHGYDTMRALLFVSVPRYIQKKSTWYKKNLTPFLFSILVLCAL